MRHRHSRNGLADYRGGRRDPIGAGNPTHASKETVMKTRLEMVKETHYRKSPLYAAFLMELLEHYHRLGADGMLQNLSLIHISEPTRQAEISYAVFCLK